MFVVRDNFEGKKPASFFYWYSFWRAVAMCHVGRGPEYFIKSNLTFPFKITQVSAAHSQDWHEPHWSPWGTTEGPVACTSGEEAFAIHWCCLVHCCWPVGGNSEFTALPNLVSLLAEGVFLGLVWKISCDPSQLALLVYQNVLQWLLLSTLKEPSVFWKL